MMKSNYIFITLLYFLFGINLHAQTKEFVYELDLLTKKDDVFHVSLETPQLSKKDSIYSFVSYAPGVHQPLDFGRFVRSFYVFDKDGNELSTQKISINDWRILEPEKVFKIKYDIDDSFDMDVKKHPIYPMSGTGINEKYTIINPHGIFGYFFHLKSNPIKLKILFDDNLKIGTALNIQNDGYYHIASFYQLADSPILIGDLSYASLKVGEIETEVFVYSPTEEINANIVLELSSEVLHSAYNFIGFSPVKRYTFLMYFYSLEDIYQMPVLDYGGALEHSYSSTYALPAMPQYLPLLKDIIAHEFMHILTPLNLRSEIIANFDYSKPTSEDLHLWLYEGVTEWVAHIMQLRSGDISIEEYLKRISDKINNSEQYGNDYSLQRLSAEWSTDEGNKKYGNIYQLGALTANSLDIKLLQLSNGEKGLREVYIELIKKYGKDKPFDNESFFDKLVEITYPEIMDFIEDYIIDNKPLDYKADFASIGINYIPEKVTENAIPIFGLDLRPREGKLVIHGFSKEHEACGLEIGDVVEKIFGKKLTETNSIDVFSEKDEMKADDTYEIVVNRKGKSILLYCELVKRKDYHHFEINDNASNTAIQLKAKWLGNK